MTDVETAWQSCHIDSMTAVSKYEIWIVDPSGTRSLLGAIHCDDKTVLIEMGQLIRSKLDRLDRDSLTVLTRDGSEVMSSRVAEHELK
jgi:hypothetical protein